MKDERDEQITALQKENERFGRIIAEQQTLIARQQALLVRLEQRLAEQEQERAAEAARLGADVRRLERELLGPKTERTKIPPVDKDRNKPELSEEEKARQREERARKRRERALAKRSAMITQQVEHPLSEEMKQCPKCNGARFTALAPEESSVYDYVPGHFVRKVHRREKAACQCGRHIVVAPAPPKLVVGGQYGFGFAAFLIVEKCADSIPIHRIEKRFERLHIPMSRATMNDVLHAAAESAMPLVDRLRRRIPALEIVLADETSIKIQDRDKRGFIWVFHGYDGDSEGELVLYEFATDRSGETPARILGGSSGALVVDGYTGYNVVTDPKSRARGGCWCHLRRKLFEARLEVGDEADQGIDKMRPLFRIEHDATELGIVGTDEHLALRQKQSRPLVVAFFEWAAETKNRALPKGPLSQALTYAENQRDRLELFLSDARIPMHNNSSERRLRVVALGRKNFLFVGHPRAGRNLAGLYSLVGSCIANRVEPTEYLTDVLPKIREATSDEQLDALLPDRWRPQNPPS